MNAKFIAVAVGLLISAPLFAASDIQSDAPEIGYVDRDGVHVAYGSYWQGLQKDASDRIAKERRDYERCINPGPGLGEIANALRAFGGRARLGSFRNLGNRPQQTPRRDCGNPPADGQTGAFRLIEIDWSTGVPRRGGTLGQFAFRSPGITTVPTRNTTADRCMAFADGSGNLIPVRSTDDPDPYSFANPFGGHSDPIAMAQSTAQQNSSQAENARQRMASAEATLSGLANYDRKSGQCLMPAKRPYPPRPASLSDAQIEVQAAGSCVDLMMRRHDPAKVMGALRSVRWDHMVADMKQYQTHPAQCANIMQSQFDDAVIRGICLYTDMGCYGQMQTVIQQCMAAVRSSCGASISSWRNRVSEIDQEPINAVRQCQSATNSLSSARSQFVTAQNQSAQVQQQLATAQSSQSGPRSLSFARSRCGG